MAKQRRGEKTAAVNEYLVYHPGAGPKEIVAALAKQRIKITTAHVSNIKGKLLKNGTAKKTAKKQAAPAAPNDCREAGERRHNHAGAGQERCPYDQHAWRIPACA